MDAFADWIKSHQNPLLLSTVTLTIALILYVCQLLQWVSGALNKIAKTFCFYKYTPKPIPEETTNVKILFKKDLDSDLEVQTQNWTNLEEVQSRERTASQKLAIEKDTEFSGQGERTTFVKTSSHPS